MNSTPSIPSESYTVQDYYIVCSLSTGFAFITILIGSAILVLVWRTKPRLHTVNHLLVCNTCIASIFYCVITINNYVFLIFVPWETSDTSCRWRAYFSYVGIAGVTYSFLIQAISRFFFSVLSFKYRSLITFKAHYILILIHWSAVVLITTPTVITNDIHFHSNTICWVALKYPLHVAYTIVAYYVIPVLLIVLIYIYIYHQMRRARRNARIIANTAANHKRDLEVLHNILCLLGVYLAGGLASLMYFLTSINLIYLTSLVTLTLAVAVEKMLTILLDREIRQVVRNMICRTTFVMPFENTGTTGKIQHSLKTIQQRNIQRNPRTNLQT